MKRLADALCELKVKLTQIEDLGQMEGSTMLEPVMGSLRKIQLLASNCVVIVLGLLSAAQVSAQTTVASTSVVFGNVVAGTTSPIHNATLENTGSTPVTITLPITAPPPYAVSSTTCGATLASGTSCTISLTVTPLFVGAYPPRRW